MDIFQRSLLVIVTILLLSITVGSQAGTVGPNTAFGWDPEPLPADADGLRIICDGAQVWEGLDPPVLVSSLGLSGAFTCSLAYYNAIDNGPLSAPITGIPVSAEPGAAPAMYLLQVP